MFTHEPSCAMLISDWSSDVCSSDLLMCDVAPWLIVFVVVGLPGLLVAALFALTVREPPRRYAPSESEQPPSFAEVRDSVRRHARVFLPMFGGSAFLAFGRYAFIVLVPAYFMLLPGLRPAHAGLSFGLGFCH